MASDWRPAQPIPDLPAFSTLPNSRRIWSLGLAVARAIDAEPDVFRLYLDGAVAPYAEPDAPASNGHGRPPPDVASRGAAAHPGPGGTAPSIAAESAAIASASRGSAYEEYVRALLGDSLLRMVNTDPEFQRVAARLGPASADADKTAVFKAAYAALRRVPLDRLCTLTQAELRDNLPGEFDWEYFLRLAPVYIRRFEEMTFAEGLRVPESERVVLETCVILLQVIWRDR